MALALNPPQSFSYYYDLYNPLYPPFRFVIKLLTLTDSQAKLNGIINFSPKLFDVQVYW